MSGYDCWNRKHFKSRRKVSSELAEEMSAGSQFLMCGRANLKARKFDCWYQKMVLADRSVHRPGSSSRRNEYY